MSLFDAVDAVIHPMAHPLMNAAAMHMKQLGNMGRGVAVGAQEEGLETQGHARSFVGLRFLPPGQQLAAGASIGVNENRLHDQVALYMRIMRQRHPGHKKNVRQRAPWRRKQNDQTQLNGLSNKDFMICMSSYLCACV